VSGVRADTPASTASTASRQGITAWWPVTGSFPASGNPAVFPLSGTAASTSPQSPDLSGSRRPHGRHPLSHVHAAFRSFRALRAASAHSTQTCCLREPNALRMPNGQFCRRNLPRASLYDFLRRARAAQPSRRGIEQTAARVVTQQIMLRRWPKTVESCRAAAPNRDNPHFGDA